jgi:hypothetical protein
VATWALINSEHSYKFFLCRTDCARTHQAREIAIVGGIAAAVVLIVVLSVASRLE